MNPNEIFLTQGDTTVGFLSQDYDKLAVTKKRDENKKFLRVVDSFETLKNFVRVPNNFKRVVRYSKKTTYIYKIDAFRVIQNDDLLHKFKWFYSTSANESGKRFDFGFAKSKCDIMILDNFELQEKKASKLIKLNRIKMRRLR